MIGQLSMRYQGIYCWCLLWQTTRFYGPCNNPKTWWRHQMETFSALLALCAGNSPVPSQRPVTRSFDVLFDLRMNKRSNKQSWGCHRAHYDVTLMNPGKRSLGYLIRAYQLSENMSAVPYYDRPFGIGPGTDDQQKIPDRHVNPIAEFVDHRQCHPWDPIIIDIGFRIWIICATQFYALNISSTSITNNSPNSYSMLILVLQSKDVNFGQSITIANESILFMWCHVSKCI